MRSDASTSWRSYALQDVCRRITSGGTPARAKADRYYTSNGHRWVKTKELLDGRIWDTEEHITDAALAESAAKLLPPKTLLVAMYGATVGQLGVLAVPAACNQACCALLINEEKADPSFVFYALLHHRDRLKSAASGAAQQNINARLIRGFDFVFPPVLEQRRIGAVLGALDDKIDSNRRLAGLLEKAAATLFRARFVDFVGVDEFHESEIGQVPKGWRVMTLGDLVTARKRTVRPLDSPDRVFEHFGIPAFDDGRRAETVTGATLLSGKTLLPDGDCVLLSKLNPATRRVWWPRPNGSDPAVSSPEFLVLVPRDALPTTYLYAVVAHDERFYSELLGHVSGTTGSRQRVKPDSALSCRVLHPSDAALQDWDRAAAPLYDQAAALTRESATLASVRDALLPKLISGQIRVPDANDPTEVIEPAAEALQAATQ